MLFGENFSEEINVDLAGMCQSLIDEKMADRWWEKGDPPYYSAKDTLRVGRQTRNRWTRADEKQSDAA